MLTPPPGAELIRTGPGLWSASAAAKCAGFRCGATVMRAFHRGELTGYRLARSVRFAPEDVMAWIASKRIPAKEASK
jgi:hypothetical protein